MAFEQNLHPVTIPASADLSTKQYYVVDVDGNGNLVIPTVSGQKAVGILQDKPNALAQAGEVGVVGMVSKAVAGAAFNAGAELMTGSDGRLITATGGGQVLARALAAASGAGIIVPVYIMGPYITASGNVQSYKVRIALTQAQILTLHSVPVALVAAPGAGYTLTYERMNLQFTYGSVQATGGGVVMPVYHGATADLTVTGGLAAATILAAANASYTFGTAPAAGGLASTTNVGLDLYAATQDFAAGVGSTLIVELWYSVITLG